MNSIMDIWNEPNCKHSLFSIFNTWWDFPTVPSVPITVVIAKRQSFISMVQENRIFFLLYYIVVSCCCCYCCCRCRCSCFVWFASITDYGETILVLMMKSKLQLTLNARLTTYTEFHKWIWFQFINNTQIQDK